MIELERVTKYYGRLQALKEVTVVVKPGCVGLLGPNGAGKSTLLRTLLGLLEFSSGSARVLGRDVRRNVMDVRQRVGYMPEQETFFPQMTGLDMVAYGGELYGMPRDEAIARAHEMLDYVSAGEERYRLVDTFSTGMKQRFKLAQALCHGPELVFLDEPTNGLDPIGREEMLAMIADLARSGVNVILSSHLLHDVEKVCDALILMQDGRVVHYGSLADFKKSEGQQIEVEVRGDGTPDSFIESLRGAGLQVDREDGSDRLLVTLGGPDDLQSIWRMAIEADLEVRHLAPLTATLEGAFLKFLQVPNESESAAS